MIGNVHKDYFVFTIESNKLVLLKLYGQVKQKTLILWGENDQIIDNKLATVSFS